MTSRRAVDWLIVAAFLAADVVIIRRVIRWVRPR